jgi:hypothetical protein
MSQIPECAENNPFSLYMDKESCLQNFKHLFGVDNEEVALRFFTMFTTPEHKPFKPKVGILRWFNVCSMIC